MIFVDLCVCCVLMSLVAHLFTPSVLGSYVYMEFLICFLRSLLCLNYVSWVYFSFILSIMFSWLHDLSYSLLFLPLTSSVIDLTQKISLQHRFTKCSSITGLENLMIVLRSSLISLIVFPWRQKELLKSRFVASSYSWFILHYFCLLALSIVYHID